MVYDIATNDCATAIKNITGNNKIDLVVISHPDADHYRGFKKAFSPASLGGLGLKANELLDTGIIRFYKDGAVTSTYSKYITAKANIPTVRSLNNPQVSKEYQVGKQWGFGDSTVTFIHGHGQVNGQNSRTDPTSHDRNGASIALKVEYGDNSILLTGDAVGVKKNDPYGKHCIRTEKRILQSCSSPKGTCGDMNIDVMITPPPRLTRVPV